MLTKCADSQSGSRADNKKRKKGKARRDGAGGVSHSHGCLPSLMVSVEGKVASFGGYRV